ncbi:MAG TPA: hypothetical protein O0X25_04220 [Methanocorpusculum sp.]|nr:hypothetical protein [Methanocorpusculum sp.]HJJ57358.1 hypothetical protein [Methanocorpusculum sp.]
MNLTTEKKPDGILHPRLLQEAMRAKVVEKKTGEVIYQIVIEGNPYKPSSIVESGTQKDEFSKKMNDWYNGMPEFIQHVVTSTGSQVCFYVTLIQNNIDEENFDLQIEDYPGHSKFPEYVPPPKPRRHGAAFDFEVF